MATSIKGGNAVALSLAGALTSYVNAEVDAISAAFADTVPLPHVAAANIYVMRKAVIPAEGAALVVAPVGGKQLANHATSYGEIAYHMEVAAICQSDNDYILQAQVDRYLTAVWQVVMKYQQLDGTIDTVIGCDPVRVGYSEIYKPSHGAILPWQGGAWEVDVYVEQLTA